jgi:enterochelin esterase family protein
MPRVNLRAPFELHGRLELHAVASDVLRGNPLGDPHERELPIYVPPVADLADLAGLPVIVVLSGFTGRGQSHLETHPWKRGLVARYDDAVAAEEVPPAILALPDCFTRLGGSQYVNSSAVGRYEDHVALELVPYVAERFPHPPERRGVAGKSSGGFGALHLCMQRPGLFAACGSISGDVGFEAAYGHELLGCVRGLVSHGGDPARFLAAFATDPSLDGDAHAVISVLAMSACYAPNPDAPLGFDLPLDLATGERRADVWARWLAFDPLERVAAGADALKRLALLHLECGLADEFHLQWGLRRMVRRLAEHGVPFTHEEHDGGHFGLDARYLPLLGRMAARLTA